MNRNFIPIFLVCVLVMSCVRTPMEVVEKFHRFELSNGWSMLLPPGGYRFSEYDSVRKRVLNGYRFTSDSMVLYFKADTAYCHDKVYSFNYRVAQIEDGNIGYCLGGFEGFAEFYPYVDTVNQVSGFSGYFVENDDRSMDLYVNDYKSQQSISVAVDSLSRKNVYIVRSALKTIRYNRN